MKQKIEDVYYHEVNKGIISFKLSDEVEIKGVLKEIADTIEVKTPFYKEGDPIENYIPTKVEGYDVPFFLKWGTEVNIENAPWGSEHRPYKFHWENYKPVHLNKYCTITGQNAVVKTGKLVDYQTSHSRIQKDGKPGVAIFARFDFQNGEVLVINSTIVEE